MVRRFVTLDGEILAEEEWNLSPIHHCFWCEDRLITSLTEPCYFSFDGQHEWVTIANRENV